jgi:hypothetical protein
VTEDRFMFEGRVDDQGHVKPEHVRETAARLRRWKGRRVLVTVSRYVKRKTQPQLAYFHGPVLYYWSEHTGYAKDEMKWELKKAWLPKVRRISRLSGEEVWETPSLSDVSAEVMSEFISRCVREGNLLGITFPDPASWWSEPA